MLPPALPRLTALTAATIALSPAMAEPAMTPGRDGAVDAAPAAAAGDAQLAEVIVIDDTRPGGRLAPGPILTEVVDRAAIRASGATTATAALAARPGLWLDRGVAGATASMQGLGPAYVVVLVDGQRQLGRVDGAIDLDRFAVGDVDRIEVVRGPGSVHYGADAIAGVINLVTRDAGDERARLALRADHRRGTALDGAVAGGSDTWAGAAAAAWSQRAAVDRDPADPATTIAGFDDGHLELRGRARPLDGWRLDASAGYQLRDLRAVDAAATGALTDRRNRIEIATAQLTALRSAERGRALLTVGGSYYRDQFAVDQRGASTLDQYQDTRERLLELTAQLERRVADRHLVSGAVEAATEGLRSPRLSAPGQRTRAAAWLQHEWRLGASYQALVSPALRIDRDSQFGWHATPRLAARWDLGPELIARASVGLGYRAPSFKDQLLRFENPGAGYVVDGNPDLAPETSRSAQLGSEWRPSAAVGLAASAYVNHLTDMITAVALAPATPTTPLMFGYANVGRARTAGGDLTATYDRGRLGLEAGYAYTWSRDLDTGDGLDGLPRHRAQAAARWRDRAAGLTAAIELAVTGPRRYARGDDSVTVPTRPELRARVARGFTGGLELAIGVDNLLDVGDADLDRVAPRTFYTSVELER